MMSVDSSTEMLLAAVAFAVFGCESPPNGDEKTTAEAPAERKSDESKETADETNDETTDGGSAPEHETAEHSKEGPFREVAVGFKAACARKNDNSVVCWPEGPKRANPPSPKFRRLSAAGHGFCGIRPAGTIECWGLRDQNATDPPEGSFQQLSTSGTGGCAINEEGAAKCWGEVPYGSSDFASDEYRDVSAGARHACAVTSGGSIECVGKGPHGSTEPPQGEFREVDVADLGQGGVSCGIRTEGSMDCWGATSSFFFPDETPAGTFEQVALGGQFGCAVQSDGAAACWGNDELNTENIPSEAKFRQVSAGTALACGVSRNGTLHCWGNKEWDATDPPRPSSQ